MKSKKYGILLVGVLLALVFATLPANVCAQTTMEWVALYNGPANGVDLPYRYKVSPSGNIYVAGNSEGIGTGWDYTVVAYDTDGNERWVRRYNGPGNDLDIAASLAVDSSENVYITGWSTGSGTKFDIATIKYDSEGNQQWIRRYNAPANEHDVGFDICLDSSNNLYIAGYSYIVGSHYDYIAIKYDSDGNELWKRWYDGPGDGMDECYIAAMDSNNNFYISGLSYGDCTTACDWATVAYDSSGNELWVARYNGPGNNWDAPARIDFDSAGNVYIGGYAEGIGSVSDYTTIKYDNDGNEQWVKIYNGPGNGPDWISNLVVDSSNTVYVTGYSLGSGSGFDYATIAYDTLGNELWIRRYNGPGNGDDQGWGICVDLLGNVYVNGMSYGGSTTNYDIAFIAYDSSGNELWVEEYNGPDSLDDYGWEISVDSSGNLYLFGFTVMAATGYDWIFLKYSIDDWMTIESLIEKVKGMGLHKGIENSLVQKLENALKSLEKGNEGAAMNQLSAFINEIKAQRGKKITQDQADYLIAATQLIIDMLP